MHADVQMMHYPKDAMRLLAIFASTVGISKFSYQAFVPHLIYLMKVKFQ